MDEIEKQEREHVAKGAQRALLFWKVLRLTTNHPAAKHPYIEAMRQMSPEQLTESEIDEIEEDSAHDMIMRMADITIYHMRKAKEAMSDDAYLHVMDATENALRFAVYISSFMTEEMSYLGGALVDASAQAARRESASKAGKASKRPYEKQRGIALARYDELMKLDNFKTASRAALARKIAAHDGITVNERTIGGWLRSERERKK